MSEGYEIGWDSQIEKDGPDFEVLPEGDYDLKEAGIMEATSFRHAIRQ
jgi:hypothetical protein